MLGNLLIARENGRGVKTYGVNQAEIYNMRSTLLCIVILISCNGYTFGEIEFYPDYQRPELPEENWANDRSLNPELQQYLNGQEKPLYPRPPVIPYVGQHRGRLPETQWPNMQQPHHHKQPNSELNSRISTIARELDELTRTNNYRYPSPSGMTREQEELLDIYKNLRTDDVGNFIPRLKTNYHILDDVRQEPLKDNPDYDFHMQDMKLQEDNPETNRMGENDERNEGVPNKGTFYDAKLVDDPTEFAYPPSDPRYFDNPTTPDVKFRQTVSNEVGKDNPRKDEDYFKVHHRNDESYSHPKSVDNLGNSERRREGSVDVIAVKPHQGDETTGVYIIAVVAGISAAATVGLIAFGIGWYNLQKHVKSASDVEYPAYGVTGPNKDTSPSSGDRRLAQSAQMYHYQHQKQQIIAMESRAAASERHGSVSEADSDEENEEGDYTVYECPGLAPTGEMEVKNPLFQDDPTPAQTPAVKPPGEDVQKK